MNQSISNDSGRFFRITRHDLLRMGYKAKQIIAPANTLLIANVGGFHRRSDHKKDVARFAIHGSIRPKLIFSKYLFT